MSVRAISYSRAHKLCHASKNYLEIVLVNARAHSIAVADIVERDSLT
jgi:hypothetical protein